ncbi:hypothetical protein DPMN_048509 [Dreissena polymorpha]|uniref:Uncharacterized protein n=1 Tax=Dreissena polymorpha TaxID=45954 RepID=A0A9D4DAU2_DREPO|nr:hypothetical protein DPMN_048509 [Dreissena polymorpha]
MTSGCTGLYVTALQAAQACMGQHFTCLYGTALQAAQACMGQHFRLHRLVCDSTSGCTGLYGTALHRLVCDSTSGCTGLYGTALQAVQACMGQHFRLHRLVWDSTSGACIKPHFPRAGLI